MHNGSHKRKLHSQSIKMPMNILDFRVPRLRISALDCNVDNLSLRQTVVANPPYNFTYFALCVNYRLSSYFYTVSCVKVGHHVALNSFTRNPHVHELDKKSLQ